MAIEPDEIARADDFINESEKDATPANDEGRVPKLEADGQLGPFFIKNGKEDLNAGETLNGGTLPVPVYQNKTDNELYACDANDNTKYKFVGFVTTNSTNGNPIRLQTNGVVQGFSGLSEGEKYYVQDAVGTIGTSPGTFEILVGVAISQTELLIQKGTRRAMGKIDLSDQGADENTSTQTITLGFRPSKIVARYKNGDGGGSDGSHAEGFGIWLNGSYQSNYSRSRDANNASSDYATDKLLNVISSQATALYEVTITSVTDTGFTFSILQKQESTPSVSFIWEAEGEH